MQKTLFAEDPAAEIGGKMLGVPSWQTFGAETPKPPAWPGYEARAEDGRLGEFTRTDYREFCRAFVDAHAALKDGRRFRRQVIGKGTLHRRRRKGDIRWQGSAPRWVVWINLEAGHVSYAFDRVASNRSGDYIWAPFAGGGWDSTEETAHLPLTR